MCSTNSRTTNTPPSQQQQTTTRGSHPQTQTAVRQLAVAGQVPCAARASRSSVYGARKDSTVASRAKLVLTTGKSRGDTDT